MVPGASVLSNRGSPLNPEPRVLKAAFKSPLLVVAGSFALGIVLARLDHPTLAGTSLLLVAAGACLFGGLVALRADWRRASSLLAVSGCVVVAVSA